MHHAIDLLPKKEVIMQIYIQDVVSYINSLPSYRDFLLIIHSLSIKEGEAYFSIENRRVKG